jgi:Cu-Zn family superoxide dismutase
MTSSLRNSFGSALLALAVTSFALASPALAADGLKATADIKGCTDANVSGKATLTEQTTAEGVKEVTVEMEVTGLADGKHAVHIHQYGKCEPCGDAGGHHDPGPFGHQAPDTNTETAPASDVNHPFHMGDLINLEVKNGKGKMKHVTNRVTLSPGRLNILDEDGSAFSIHAQPDTYCDEETELKKGCAGGARDACGIIRASR